MGKAVAIVVAAAVGLIVAVGLGLLFGQAPVFHWEMAGLFVAFIAGAGGLVAGALGAASGRAAVGACVGVLLAGVAFALLSVSEQHNPPALTLWGTVAVAAAAGVAGALGGVIGRRVGQRIPG